ncbi:amidohydrolase family protein [Dethiobacter alkaliphilus]|uniref:amidohydrolase family protein n=1 Tax=Dethiobacter alkaliphilus TaxID=427926 RepID=UPI0022275198|nr:amidohydrolase family protein [Dethiobacter alkaliphilus]MCW3489718.1 amidohydrolase family protein [Dethiobacter alkaliphilus]
MNYDAHVHLVGEGWVHENFFLGVARVYAAAMGKSSGELPDPNLLLAGIKGSLFDTSGDKLVKDMDEAGIDRSNIFTIDYGLLTGEPDVSIEEQNKLIAEAVKRFPDRLSGFFTIDPRRPEALELFCRAVEDWGMRGLKLHPSSGWFPYDEIAYPLYEQCTKYKLPMIIHTGGQPAPMKSRFGRPVYVDDVAADFPDLKIIMAHCGYRWWEEALLVCSYKPNCHVDISGWQLEFVEKTHNFYRMLRRLIDDVGPWRVIFGSDGPYLNGMCSLKDWVGAFRNPDAAPQGITFTKEEIDAVMGRSIARIMK